MGWGAVSLSRLPWTQRAELVVKAAHVPTLLHYDNVIRDRQYGRGTHRAKAGPHWMRRRVLDPATLRDVTPGEPGLLCHVDLANAGTALAVLTEDIGREGKDGFEVIGRAAGAEARGCSLALAGFQESPKSKV